MPAERERCNWCGGDADPTTACPKSIVCPTCAAKPGESCRRPSGHRASTMHASRWQKSESGFASPLPSALPFGEPGLF